MGHSHYHHLGYATHVTSPTYGTKMNSEPTLSDLEDQEPTTQEDLEAELRGLHEDLGNVRIMMRLCRSEEETLMTRRSWIRTQLRLLRDERPHVTIPAEVEKVPTPPPHFYVGDGISGPMCPDCTPDDD